MDTVPFHAIPDPPPAIGAGQILSRMADGIGFRFRWATEGLRDADMGFRPAKDCKTLGELLLHVMGLLSWVADTLAMEPRWELLKSTEPGVVRGRVLDLATQLSSRFKAMSEADLRQVTIGAKKEEAFPVWNIVNGPLSDSLTHIGQILSWRRMAGNPALQADVFRGMPPKA